MCFTSARSDAESRIPSGGATVGSREFQSSESFSFLMFSFYDSVSFFSMVFIFVLLCVFYFCPERRRVADPLSGKGQPYIYIYIHNIMYKSNNMTI